MSEYDERNMLLESAQRIAYLKQLHLDTLKRRWAWFVVLGIVMIILGGAALVHSVVATLTTMVVVGCLMMAGGLVEAVGLISSVRNRDGVVLSLLTGILYVVCGWMLATNPGAGALAFTLIVAMFLFFGGIYRILISLLERHPGWAWVLVHGLLNVLMGVFIWRQWPISGLWVVGLFVGLDMIFHGSGFLLLGLVARKLSRQSSSA